MRITVLTTSTNNTRAIYEPLSRLGHDLTVIPYDLTADHGPIPGIVHDARPDWVLLIGAIEGHHANVIPVDVLAEIGKKHLLVNLCFDGAEPAWWDQLQAYYDRGNFALQVNIDGVRTGPVGDRGLTMLCPIDASAYQAPDWSLRPIAFGFPGNAHRGARADVIWDLVRRGVLTYRVRDNDDGSGTLFRAFLQACRCIFNHPMTGGTTSTHVKARFLEAGLAGCLVFELEGSPAQDWFDAGQEFMPYVDAEAVVANLDWVARNLSEAQGMALRLRERIRNEHSPEVFWSHVHERLGLGRALRPLRQVPFRHWHPSMAGPASNGNGAVNGHYHGPQPQLLVSAQFHNFVSFKGKIHVIPQVLGSIDVAGIDLASYPTIRSFSSMDEARRSTGFV